MNDRRLSDAQITAALRAHLPARAQAGLPRRVMDAVETTSQRRPLPSILGAFSDPDLARGRRSLLIAAALLLGLALASAAAVGAWQLLRRDTTPNLDLIQGPLPSLPASLASNGWIAYSTDGAAPGTTDITTGSDMYLVREGTEPKLIAGRQGGTTRNVCPVFSPDGSKLAFGVAGPQGRTVAVVGLDPNGVIRDPVSIMVPGTGPAACPRWSTDGKRIAYLLDDPTALGRPTLVIRGLDGSKPTRVDGDPSAEDFGIGRQSDVPLLSPSGAWTVRVEINSIGCELVVAKPNGTAAHIIALSYCPYAIAAWSPDGRQVLLMKDVSGEDFTMYAMAVDGLSNETIVSTVRTNGGRSWPGWGDVSWQPVFP